MYFEISNQFSSLVWIDRYNISEMREFIKVDVVIRWNIYNCVWQYVTSLCDYGGFFLECSFNISRIVTKSLMFDVYFSKDQIEIF